MRVGWLLVAVTGCAFDVTLPSTGQPPGDDDPTPTPLDRDGDTIVDADDNCPAVANTDQRDHDADTRGDACDPCPHVGPATDADDDGDGIGNACDPRVGADTLVVWDGFYDDSAAMTAWTRSSGTWTLADGAFRQTDVRGGAIAWPASIPRAYVDVAYTTITVGPSYTVTSNGQTRTVYPSVGTIAGANDPQNHGYGCALAKDPTNRVTAWSVIDDQFGGSPEMWSGDLVPEQRYRIVQSLATANACAFSQGDTITKTDDASLGGTAGSLTIYTAAAGAAFDYVFVVAIGS